jgi:hypothetical protein
MMNLIIVFLSGRLLKDIGVLKEGYHGDLGVFQVRQKGRGTLPAGRLSGLRSAQGSFRERKVRKNY